MSASNNNLNSRPIFSLRMVDDSEASPSNDIKEQDRLLPIANVGRIMKQILPPNAKISKEAKETMQECVSEFIGFVTSEASEKCRKERRKTVNGDDICWALGALGFDDYAGPLKRYLNRYREIEVDRGNQNKAGNSEEMEENFLLHGVRLKKILGNRLNSVAVSGLCQLSKLIHHMKKVINEHWRVAGITRRSSFIRS
ncbi:hypothetical protein Pfo_026067 [Paulownia fortunei]|nr:hypothetical protein Pfo_026067 [Paulownia fortunei]